MKIALAFPIGPLSLQRYLDICKRNGWSALVLGADSYRQQAENAGAEFVAADLASANTSELIIKLEGKGLRAIVPGGEYSVAVADRIAAGLKLPHNPLTSGDAFRNKAQMRERFNEFGVPQPQIIVHFASSDAVAAFDWQAVSFPVIVKPIDMASSLFVRVCHNAEQAKELLAAIFSYVEAGAEGQPFSRGALVEELATGQEYSAECLVQDGKLLRLFLTTKYLSPWPHCNEVGHLSGDELTSETMTELKNAVAGIIKAWAITDTVMHVEFKLTPKGIRVIEAGNRVAGDRISELVELRHRISLEECFCMVRAQSKLDLPSPSLDAAAPFVGVKFFFDTARPELPQMSLLREDAWAPRVAMTPMVYDIKQRLGFQIVSSASRDALERFIRIDTSATAVN